MIRNRMTSINFLVVTVTLLGAVILAVGYTPPTTACSRILWNTNKKAVVCARSFDWAHSFEDYLFVYPRGLKRDGGIGKNSAQWTSKYGSVCATVYGYASKHGFGIHDGGSDGINEKGLAVHLLYLEETKYEKPDQRPGVTYMRWVSYLLDNYATVKEAVAGMKKIRIVPVALGKEKLGLHVAMEDPTGDSAIVEYIDGNLVIHHGKQYAVMTNDPVYNVQIENLKRYKSFGGTLELPGSTEPDDRFVRAAYFLKHLPEPKNQTQAVGYAFSAIRNVAVPFGAPYKGRTGAGTYPTWWLSATDCTNRIFYFNWTKNPNIIWVEIKNVDFSKESAIRMLNPRNPSLVGDVSQAFEKAP